MATPREELIFALENKLVDRTSALKRINYASTKTNISSLLDQPFLQLSGGEKQRVALAVLIAMKSDLLLLDEPFANCDSHNRQFLLTCLATLHKEGKTILISDHNFSGYEKLASMVLAIKDKNIKTITLPDNTLKNQALSFSLPDLKQNPVYFLKSFSLSFPKKNLISPTNLKIYPGRATLLTGENGSGKTSLFKALTKIIPYQGQLIFESKDIKKWHRRPYLAKVGQIFQNPDDQFLNVTVKEELDFSLKYNRNLSLNKIKLEHLLTKLNLQNLDEQVVYSLSGGQKRKLQILVMLMAYPEVLLLDEPFSGLDQESVSAVIYLLKKYFLDSNHTLLVISHQLEQVQYLCDYHLTIKDQKLFYTK
ncbi:ATP-binding cassette domain-containing protein [Lactobacillus gasseri]